MKERIGVIGLGYVGLPLAAALARHFPVIGCDIDSWRINGLRLGIDATKTFAAEELQQLSLTFTDKFADLTNCTCFIVCVPTPVKANKSPDLEPLKSACRSITQVIRPGSLVIFESTVYPGCTEEICIPILDNSGVNFVVGYSPERLSPGDSDRSLAKVVKAIAGDSPATTDRMEKIYSFIIAAGIHRAPSIKVAEFSKVLENCQRDVNIALMNEAARICGELGISIWDVLATAKTKWNFAPYTPGLVGGHCIGVDPYYLIAAAQSLGLSLYPNEGSVLRSARQINEEMVGYIGQEAIALLKTLTHPADGKVLILGLTFKENVPDCRNSKAIALQVYLEGYGVQVAAFDPLVANNPPSAADLVILAVPHDQFLAKDAALVKQTLSPNCILMDLKGALLPWRNRLDVATYWTL